MKWFTPEKSGKCKISQICDFFRAAFSKQPRDFAARAVTLTAKSRRHSARKNRAGFCKAKSAVFVFEIFADRSGHDVGKNSPARINRLGDFVIVVARNDDRISVRIQAGNDADVPATL